MEALVLTLTSTKQKAIETTIITTKYKADAKTINPNVLQSIVSTNFTSFSSTFQ